MPLHLKARSLFNLTSCVSAAHRKRVKPLLSERVATALLVEMASGNYSAEKRFLSNRNVARYWEVSSLSADKGLQQLVKWGLLTPKDRSGYYLVPDFRQRALARLNPSPSTVLPRQLDWQMKLYSKQRQGKTFQRMALILIPNMPEGGGQDLDEACQHALQDVSNTARAIFLEAERAKVMVDCYIDDRKAESRHRIVEQVRSTNAQGVLIVRRLLSSRVAPMVSTFLSIGLPVVTAYDDCEQTNMVSINFNNVGIGHAAARIFLDHGHRKIGVLHKTKEQYIYDRFLGSELAASELNDPRISIEPFFLEYSYTDAKIHRLFGRRFNRNNPNRPTALLATDALLLTRLQPLFKSEKLIIPRDLSVIICSPVPEIPGFQQSFDIMKLDFAEIGSLAFRTLEKLYIGSSCPPCVLVTPPYRPSGTVTSSQSGEKPAKRRQRNASVTRAPRKPGWNKRRSPR